MTTNRTLGIISILILGFLAQGCTSTPKHINSGFLDIYDKLEPLEDYPNVLTYKAPGFDRQQLRNTKKIHVEDFELWLQPGHLQVLGSEQLADVVKYFGEQLRKSLSEYYQIVETPDAETLTIRGAFSNIQVSTPELSAADFIPFRIVMNAGNAAYLQSTDQQDLLSRVGIEAEFRIGENKQLVFAMTSVKELDTTVSNYSEGDKEAVKTVLNTWIDNFISKIRKIRQQS
jgi:hypothetical protein